MRRSIVPVAVASLTGLVSLGVMGLTASAAAGDTSLAAKREDQATELVAVSDDEDEDDDEAATGAETSTNSGTGTGRGDGTAGTITYQDAQTGTNTATNTGSDNSTHDMTNSRFTAVSRDGELSRGDLTRDWTMDGGDRTIDLTPNLTNDKSRNDTRAVN